MGHNGTISDVSNAVRSFLCCFFVHIDAHKLNTVASLKDGLEMLPFLPMVYSCFHSRQFLNAGIAINGSDSCILHSSKVVIRILSVNVKGGLFSCLRF